MRNTYGIRALPPLQGGLVYQGVVPRAMPWAGPLHACGVYKAALLAPEARPSSRRRRGAYQPGHRAGK
jgi:hypothetical protein